jgi:LmbE family N-acetylglucosaminyl deacetylase/CheY-like chemotaxis protein
VTAPGHGSGTGDGRERRGLVLLVEDDDALADLVRELLAPLAEVHWMPSAEEAIARLGDAAWDLVLSDVELPGASGLELARAAKAAHPNVAILILSGHASFEYAVEAIRAGADDYMTKPLDPARLIAKVIELIATAQERRASGRESVLAIGAHPDDVEIGVGGILLRHAAAGHDVAVLTLTGGEEGGTPEQRAQESERAAELMSAHLFHVDLTDTSVSEGGATIAAIKRVIDEVLPSTIYTHTARDVHQDHRNVHHATLVAARGVARVYCYQAPSTTVEFHPTRFVAIDDHIDGKLEVIEAFASQVALRDYLDPELLRSTARYWGRFSRARYVEPLEVVRESDVGGAAGAGAPSARETADAG